jgi:hypothetical protein
VGRDGRLVAPDFVDAAACDRLMARAAELLAGFDPATVSVFSTTEQTQTTDGYFLESGDQVRFFVEDGAVDADGRLNRPKEQAVNKIGPVEPQPPRLLGPHHRRHRRLPGRNWLRRGPDLPVRAFPPPVG